MKTCLIAAAVALGMTPALAHAEAFNGAYVGADLGWETNRAALGDGFAFGLVAGYNKKVADQLVLGVEAKAALSTAGKTIDEANIDAGRSLGIAGRVGVLATPSTLVFGKIGYENIRTKVFVSEGAGYDFSFNTDALTLGAGIEQAVSQQATLRLGYDYTDGEDGYRRHQVKVGVGIHF